MRILVTGAAGNIGRLLVKELNNNNLTVVAADRKVRPKEFTEDIQYICKDLNDLEFDDFEAIRPEVVVHLAASFERLIESPKFAEINFRDNVKLSNHIFSFVKKSNYVHKYIFASSYLVYRIDSVNNLFNSENPLIFTEDSEIRPRNLIGSAKLFHESELNHFRLSNPNSHLKTLSFRIFRGYNFGDNCVISRWCRAIANGKSLDVYNAKNSFDFISAEESAYIIARACQISINSNILNLGSGKSVPIYKIIESLRGLRQGIKTVPLIDTKDTENTCAGISALDGSFPLRRDFPDVFERLSDMLIYEEAKT